MNTFRKSGWENLFAISRKNLIYRHSSFIHQVTVSICNKQVYGQVQYRPRKPHFYFQVAYTSCSFKKRDAEKAHRLKILAALSECLSSDPSTDLKHGGLQTSITLGTGNPVPSSNIFRHQAQRWSTIIRAGKILIYLK